LHPAIRILGRLARGAVMLGPVMIDVEGTTLSPEDVRVLTSPPVGGVILFSRNFESFEQLHGLCREIHGLRRPPLLIAVDQEGGRIQRFRDPFTRLPAARRFGECYARRPAAAKHRAEEVGWLMAVELRAAGVDFSFAPVLDLDRGVSRVIGDRSFAEDPLIVAELARAWTRGVHDAGMAAVAKHFPGHGAVAADSHLELPVDERPFADVWANDIRPFRMLIESGIEAVMPAHVLFPGIAAELAGFSRYWLQEVLRDRLAFPGVIFSDDLSMGATSGKGGYAARARAAVAAGCDMVLVCNHREAALEVLDALHDHEDPVSRTRILRMHGRLTMDMAELRSDPRWHGATRLAGELDAPEGFELDFS